MPKQCELFYTRQDCIFHTSEFLSFFSERFGSFG